MNVFYLDTDPVKCAQAHVDRHVVKMIVEYAQLLSTARRLRGDDVGYKQTHVNHPCAVWVRESNANYAWLHDLMVATADEYTFRYGKVHATSRLFSELWLPASGEFTKPALAMPEEYHCSDPLLAYRLYYRHGKSHLHKWTNRNPPPFIYEEEYAKVGT